MTEQNQTSTTDQIKQQASQTSQQLQQHAAHAQQAAQQRYAQTRQWAVQPSPEQKESKMNVLVTLGIIVAIALTLYCLVGTAGIIASLIIGGTFLR